MRPFFFGILLLSLVFTYSCKRKNSYGFLDKAPEETYWFERDQATDLSGQNWHIWLDSSASWANDTLFIQPKDLSGLTSNQPSCGWDILESGAGRSVKLPATVEEYFWGQNGNSYGTAGDYMGVSWFSTVFNVPQSSRNKRIMLHFESARMRAEVYINRQLAGYNLIDGLPFEVDATPFVAPGKNHLTVRITDPGGDFTWCDWPLHSWGKYSTIPSHAFGGITGRVRMYTTDKSYIEDVYVKNKPSITDIDVEVNLKAGDKPSGALEFALSKWGEEEVLASEKIIIADSTRNKSVYRKTISLPGAEKWSPDTPALYTLKVAWKGTDGSQDIFTRRFGFRWFEVRDVKGDKQFYLNNKRIVLRSAISWGFWPVNGIYPTYELAYKQITIAKRLGLNMLNFHRCIGQSHILNLADEFGLLYYEEPGGYREGDDKFSQSWGREKLLRMVKRDRNHPSLIIYNIANESGHDPKPQTKVDIADAHKLDETRIITYTSSYFAANMEPYGDKCPKTPAPIKMHMLPYNHTILYQGWWDEHHAGGPGSYNDELYNGPSNYYLNSDHAPEIIFYGEEGAIGTPGRLELMKNTIQQQDSRGWDGNDYLKLFDTYDHFLSDRGFRKAFPNVDNLTRSLGNVAYYYQGRIIENMRINNTNDGYVVNGWEEIKLENHSGIVDGYRNPKGDMALIAYYNQPLYLAVKARNKVIKTNSESLVDIYIVNENNLNGDFNLTVKATDASGEVLNKTYPVKVSGGNVYGELLIKDISVKPKSNGYCNIEASLLQNDAAITSGKEQLFCLLPDGSDISKSIGIMDTSGILQKYLATINIKTSVLYKDGRPATSILLVGAAKPVENYTIRHDLYEWVAEGHTLILAGSADKWAESMNRRDILDYRGKRPLGKLWYGGNYFVKESPLFADLPVNCAFNWEYQSLIQYSRDRYGLRIIGDQTIVGAVSDHRQELYSAVSIIPFGRGKIILSTLDILGALKEGKRSSVTAGKILLNYLEYASRMSL